MRLLVDSCVPVSLDRIDYLDAGAKYAAVTFDDGFESVIRNGAPELERLLIPATFFVPTGYLGECAGWIKDAAFPGYGELVIGEATLNRMRSDLFTIAAHGAMHQPLTNLSISEAYVELQKSKEDLERILGKSVKYCSFPYDDYDSTTVTLAKEAGYSRVFTGLPGLRPLSNSGFLCGRVLVSPNDWDVEFRLKLVGAYSWLQSAVMIKRFLSRAAQLRTLGRKKG